MEGELNSTKLQAAQSASKMSLLEAALAAEQAKAAAETAKVAELANSLQVRTATASDS